MISRRDAFFGQASELIGVVWGEHDGYVATGIKKIIGVGREVSGRGQ